MLLLVSALSCGCTNLIVTPGASADGASLLAYNADDSMILGALSHWPGGKHAPGETRETFSWDDGYRIGSIPQVSN
jgi:dipeptidase